jgi:hypothetical protein
MIPVARRLREALDTAKEAIERSEGDEKAVKALRSLRNSYGETWN